MHSPKFEYYKDQYDRQWITRATLRQWVAVCGKFPQLGITPEEYEEITGDPYEEA